MSLTVAFQRLEAASILLAALYFYGHLHFSWVWFAALLFVVDVFMVGYLLGERIGALTYNVGHSTAMPALLMVLGSMWPSRALLGMGIIWLAHVGLDRMLGYGLKFPDGFRHTHLGSIGGGKTARGFSAKARHNNKLM